MEKIVLNEMKDAEDILLKFGEKKFTVKTIACGGSYFEGRLICLYGMDNNCQEFIIKNVGYSKPTFDMMERGDDKKETRLIDSYSNRKGCLVNTLITFEKGLELAIDYLNKIV